jgi:hypothetical protein
VSLIYIKKWLITKQQDQLNSYFMSQDDAVVLFHNLVTETPADATSREALQPENTKPIIQLFNPALKNMTGIEVPPESSTQNQDMFSNIKNDDLEIPVFEVKNYIDKQKLFSSSDHHAFGN